MDLKRRIKGMDLKRRIFIIVGLAAAVSVGLVATINDLGQDNSAQAEPKKTSQQTKKCIKQIEQAGGTDFSSCIIISPE